MSRLTTTDDLIVDYNNNNNDYFESDMGYGSPRPMDDDDGSSAIIGPNVTSLVEQIFVEDGYTIVGPNDVTNLTPTQQIILSVIGIPTGIVSVWCSYLIMKKVALVNRFDTPLNRILFMFSLCDIVATVNYLMNPFLLPRETSFRHWTFGTTTTCSVSGAFYMFGFSSFWYYLILSVYFVLTIRFQVTQDTIRRYWEYFFHVWPLGYSLTIVVVGIFADDGRGFFYETDVGQRCAWSFPKRICDTEVEESIAFSQEYDMSKCVKVTPDSPLSDRFFLPRRERRRRNGRLLLLPFRLKNPAGIVNWNSVVGSCSTK